MTLDSTARKEYGQIVRLHERMLARLQSMLDELDSPSIRAVLQTIESRTGESAEEYVQALSTQIEEAIRVLRLSESRIREDLDQFGTFEVEGVPNLPPRLMRFLAERRDSPGFSYEVDRDEIRGWIIRWKEYTEHGTVRGFGQFYEKPYAFIND